MLVMKFALLGDKYSSMILRFFCSAIPIVERKLRRMVDGVTPGLIRDPRPTLGRTDAGLRLGWLLMHPFEKFSAWR